MNNRYLAKSFTLGAASLRPTSLVVTQPQPVIHQLASGKHTKTMENHNS